MPNQPNENIAPENKANFDKATQELFDMFVLGGMELIYDEKQAKSMLPRLGNNQKPVKAIAELLVDIIVRVTTTAKSAGKKIPPEVVLHGGNLLFAELLKVLEAAGMEPLTDEQKESVWQIASSIYIDQAIKSGEMTKQELMALSKQVEQTDQGKEIMAKVNPGGGDMAPEQAVQPVTQPVQQATGQPVASNSIAAPIPKGV